MLRGDVILQTQTSEACTQVVVRKYLVMKSKTINAIIMHCVQ